MSLEGSNFQANSVSRLRAFATVPRTNLQSKCSRVNGRLHTKILDPTNIVSESPSDARKVESHSIYAKVIHRSYRVSYVSERF